MTQRKKVKPGDILEFATSHGRGYLHYVGRHPEYGDAVVVCPTQYQNRVTEVAGLFSAGYVAFYPVSAAIAQGLVQIVGHAPSPSLPTRVRRPGARVGTHVETWIVEDGHAEEVRSELSEAERHPPIAVIWNHELLAQRVREGWRPEREPDGHE